MPRKDIILNLPGYTIVKVTGNNPVYIQVKYHRIVRCIYCNGKRLRKKDSYERKIRYESIGLRYSYICIKAHKFQCYECKRYYYHAFWKWLKNSKKVLFNILELEGIRYLNGERK